MTRCAVLLCLVGAAPGMPWRAATAQASVPAQVPAGGAWTKVLSYDAFGSALGFDASTAGTEMLYNGESFNARTGQQNLRARWYDPSAGRFTGMDPYPGRASRPATLNVYGYCGADPIGYADPMGANAILYGAMFATLYTGLDNVANGLPAYQGLPSAAAAGAALGGLFMGIGGLSVLAGRIAGSMLVSYALARASVTAYDVVYTKWGTSSWDQKLAAAANVALSAYAGVRFVQEAGRAGIGPP